MRIPEKAVFGLEHTEIRQGLDVVLDVIDDLLTSVENDKKEKVVKRMYAFDTRYHGPII